MKSEKEIYMLFYWFIITVFALSALNIFINEFLPYILNCIVIEIIKN